MCVRGGGRGVCAWGRAGVKARQRQNSEQKQCTRKTEFRRGFRGSMAIHHPVAPVLETCSHISVSTLFSSCSLGRTGSASISVPHTAKDRSVSLHTCTAGSAESSSCAMSASPRMAAKCKGRLPSSFVLVASRPASSNARAAPSCPKNGLIQPRR